MTRMLVCSLFAVLFLHGSFSTAVAQEKVSGELEVGLQGRNRAINIDRPGRYVLRNDLRVGSGDAITIRSSDVTLDLRGYAVTTGSPGTGTGIRILGASGVEVKNGIVGGFNMNVTVADSSNVNVHRLQISGRGLAPNNGPSEIGIVILQSRGVFVSRNNISSVNLGIFVRGGNATGNRIFENVIVGGATASSNLLGICYNPAPNAGEEGPRGDNIYNNHVTRYGYAFAISSGSIYNVFNENVSASFLGEFREPGAINTNGGTNVSEGNIAVVIPQTDLPN
ncbi:MAG: hypothetical protein IPM21_08900 [Acidobacteria bacterium]|nr:hypothetical protein [Acidobacteriota bacterium]